MTTKLPPEDAGRAAEVLDESLGRLGLDHVDLWLVHWPPAASEVVPVWEAFRAARESGRVRAIGVSNYDLAPRLAGRRDRRAAGRQPDPVEPVPPRSGAAGRPPRARRRARGLQPAAGTDLTDPALVAIADGHGVTPAQVVLRWHLQRGIVVIPKSGNPERIRSNLDLWSFDLTDDELAVIDGLG